MATKVGVILLNESQQFFLSQSLWNTNDKNGLKIFLNVCDFSAQYRGVHHLELYCTLTIEA